MNPDPDYSAAYVVVRDRRRRRPRGPRPDVHDRTRQRRSCVAAVEALRPLVVGPSTSRSCSPTWARSGGRWSATASCAGSARRRASSTSRRPRSSTRCGTCSRSAPGKPLWQLLADMSPAEQVVAASTSATSPTLLTPDEALACLERLAPTRARARGASCGATAIPRTPRPSAGSATPDDKIRRLCREAIAEGWTRFKMKVGADVADDIRRARHHPRGDRPRPHADGRRQPALGRRRRRSTGCAQLAPFDPYWIEEPTSPDDILGHAAIARAVAPIRVATGEHVHNRVMFKQLLQADAIGVCQIDACRLGGVNEVLAVLLLAAEIRRPGLPARRRRRTVRVRPAPVDLRLRRASAARSRAG